ncbi:GNAT family N-acetyltransferase [Methyloversatilis thermotolerans]|uniref:GNAT family N-acetyltransferase n=1 Tax=Methyloversatilis thermotolerans TaxID=1346290 RepID=UPI000373F98D|nr:GNAT family N-acetyltransferase [Methyloversatilis thermotolerans]
MRIEYPSSIDAIPAAQWNALVGLCTPVTHAFLSALERSGCVRAETGWVPDHVALYDGDRLAGALPGYRKFHSYGEYVFDWAWAEALERSGRAYYPKLLCASPFTPVPGPRLLAIDAAARTGLLDAWLEHARTQGVSSAHLLFPDAESLDAVSRAGMLLRTSVQFHWHNHGYRDFDDFLASLSASKRKKIRQERRRVAELGVTVRIVEGRDITDSELELFVRCYRNTYRVRAQRPYLNQTFFEALRQDMPEGLVLFVASRQGRDFACAMNLRDRERLYGRWWGEIEHHPFVHFEVCYYQGIAYSIEHGMKVFEGGAQGEHKMARGFTPVETFSAHWLRDPDMREAVADYLARERAGVARHIDELEDRSPFRQRCASEDAAPTPGDRV